MQRPVQWLALGERRQFASALSAVRNGWHAASGLEAMLPRNDDRYWAKVTTQRGRTRIIKALQISQRDVISSATSAAAGTTDNKISRPPHFGQEASTYGFGVCPSCIALPYSRGHYTTTDAGLRVSGAALCQMT
jgi:hypothetical protein